MSIEQKIRKVFSNGGTSNQVHLNNQNADRFIDYMVDESSLLKKIKVVRMNTPEKTIAKVGIGEKVLYPAGRTAPLTDAQTTEAATDSLVLKSKKMRARVVISDDELEDNIEGQAFRDHLMRMVSTAARNQVEASMFTARHIADSTQENANVVDIKNQFDGIFAQAGVVLDAATESDRFIDKLKLSKLRKMFKTKYRQGLEIFINDDLVIDYQDKYAILQGWNTADQVGAFGKKFNNTWLMSGDSPFVVVSGVSTTAESSVQGSKTITVASATGITAGMDLVFNYGLETEFTATVVSVSSAVLTLDEVIPYTLNDSITVKECELTGAEVLMTDPKNINWGIQRDFTLEYERDAERELNKFFLSLRMDLKVENSEACGYIKNLSSR